MNMRESQRRINEYKRALPRLKEKVIAVALLLAVSASMMVTVTFAWVALSTNPEVSGVNTSIASNGNLEIALATGTLTDASAPGASQIGDSNLDTLLRNITWGNLINLGDARYGLDNIVLRPALLNEFGLVDNPLYGPVYDETGRVIDMNTNFGYSAWDSAMSRFSATENLGVRAITSMTYGTSSDSTTYSADLNTVVNANVRVQNRYQEIAYNSDYMSSLSSMMAGFMVKNVFKKNDNLKDMISYSKISENDLDRFIAMYEELIACFEQEADVFADLLNLQAEIEAKHNKKTEWVTITGADILNSVDEYDTTTKAVYNLLKPHYTSEYYTPAANGIIVEIDTFLSDYDILITDIVKIRQIRSKVSGSVTWDESSVPAAEDGTTLDDLIKHLVDVNTCTITGGEYKNLKVQNIGGTAALALMKVDVCHTDITNGVLWRFDNRSGARLKNKDGEPLTLTVSLQGVATIVYGNSQSISSNVATSATQNYFDNERAAVEALITKCFGAPERIAEDSYGFAVDFWVRTNAANSYLTLQGNVLTETKKEPVIGKDMNGNDVDLYTITVKVQQEESETESSDTSSDSEGSIFEDMATATYDVYKYTRKNSEGQDETVLLYASNHQDVTKESLGLSDEEQIPTPIQKMEDVEYVIGFEGDNRIWEGDQHSLLSVNSTTQGSGSCYVFYAETPVDQERSLELLKSMKVAFVDANGTLLATAFMDTDRHYSDSGKVIVPLVLERNDNVLGTDNNGDIRYGITALEQNVPTRITAVVYLDGTVLTNDKVLASADIEGKMNIQFGSSAVLYPLDNETLYNSELYAEVDSISPGSFDYDTLAEGDSMTSHVKVRITGTQPKIVTANFIRRINATQGSPEETFILTDADGDGVWEGDYTFLSPGTYILRSVTMDGVERDIVVPKGSDGKPEYPAVKINGFSIQSVSYFTETYVMSDAGSFSPSVSLKFASDDPEKMPTSVIGKFTRGDGAAVNVNFVYNPTLGLWQGRADFVSSGEYTMQYVVLDGEYTELAEEHRHTVELVLGMRVDVETTSPTLLFYNQVADPDPRVEIRDENDNIVSNVLKMRVKILDNSGNIVPNLAGASLQYSMVGTEELYAKLTYNEVEKLYEGEFPIENAGTYSFDKVTVEMGENSSDLYSVNADAPIFTIVPPTPPSYDSNDVVYVAQLVSAGNNGVITVSLKESSSATVYAKIRNAKNEVKYVLATLEGTTGVCTYHVAVPAGLWTLEGVSVTGVFDDQQQYRPVPVIANPDVGLTEEQYDAGIVFDSATTSGAFVNCTVAVLDKSTITTTVSYNESSDGKYVLTNNAVVFGKDSNGTVTSAFMDTHEFSAGSVSVSFSDTHNLLGTYFKIQDVTLSYKYGEGANATDNKYGGYTDGKDKSSIGSLTFGATDSLNKVFRNTTAYTLQYACSYNPEALSYKIVSDYNSLDNANASLSENTLKEAGAFNIEVFSKRPSVTVSAITPTTTESIPTKIVWTQKSGIGKSLLEYTLEDSANNELDTANNSATVYAKATTGSDGEGVGTGDAGFVRPTVSFAVAGVDTSSTVKVTIPKGNSSKDVAVERKGNGTTSSVVLGETFVSYSYDGYRAFVISVTYTVRGYRGHENQTISTVTIERDGITYTVTLEKPIVINNPSSVNKTS